MRSPAIQGPALLALSLALAAATGAAADELIECEMLSGGAHSLRLEVPPGASVRERALGPRVHSLELTADPLAGERRAGTIRCAGVRTVSVVPGAISGDGVTRLVVTHDGPAPRAVAGQGYVRLLWLPAVDGAGEPQPETEPVTVAPPRAIERERTREVPRASAPVAERPPANERTDQARTRQTEVEEARRLLDVPPPGRIEPTATPEPAESFMTPPPRPGSTAGSAARTDVEFLPTEPVQMVASIATELRDGPGRRHAAAGKVKEGDSVVVVGRAGDWLKTTGGSWVFAGYLEAPASAIEGGAFMASVQGVSAPVHAGPGGQHPIVAELYRGERVVIDEMSDDWAHVRNGGWVKLSLLARVAGGETARP